MIFFLSKIHYAIVAKLYINQAKNEDRIGMKRQNEREKKKNITE